MRARCGQRTRSDSRAACSRAMHVSRSRRSGVATLLYSGHVEATHKNPHDTKVTNHGKARLRGVGLYDVKKGQLLSLTLVTEGTFTPYPYQGKRTTFATAAAVDWRREPKARR